MKALTLHQPWATLVAIGAKRIETRSWRTHYRGPLAIHAAKTIPPEARRFIDTEAVIGALIEYGTGPSASLRLVQRDKPGGGCTLGPDSTLDIETGAVIAIVDLFQVRKTDSPECRPPYPDAQFGDFRPGRFAWYFASRYQLPKPIPACGRQGLWDWTPPAELDLGYGRAA